LFARLKKNLEAVQWHDELEGKSVEGMWEVISNKIMSAVEDNVPHKFVEDKFSGQRRKPLCMNSRVLAQVRKKDKKPSCR